MGNIIKACCESSEKNDHSSDPVKDISPILEKKEDSVRKAELVPEIEVESVISSSSSSSSSSNSTVGDIEESSELTAEISEPENDAKDNSESEQPSNGEANKDSSCVVVGNDKCSPDFDESSDKDNEVVNEPVTQIEVLNNDAIDDSIANEDDES